MSRFAIRTPYLVVVAGLVLGILGVVSVARMPVDLFPAMNIPVVAVATFYSGMPPEQVEGNITYHLERFFTLASGIEHMESRSLAGRQPDQGLLPARNESRLRRHHHRESRDGGNQPSSSGDAAAFCYEDGRVQPAGLPGHVPGEGLSETQLKDLAQNVVRNQLASVPGAAVPQPFGGRSRQIMLYADPLKLEAHQLSLMDVVRADERHESHPARRRRPNRKLRLQHLRQQRDRKGRRHQPCPGKDVGRQSGACVGYRHTKDAYSLQYNAVRVDGQRSVYLPVLKQGGDSNTIAVVDGVREKVRHLFDMPPSLASTVVFDQSQFVKTAIRHSARRRRPRPVAHVGDDPAVPGQPARTIAVFFSIPLSVCATLVALQLGGSTQQHGAWRTGARIFPVD